VKNFKGRLDANRRYFDIEHISGTCENLNPFVAIKKIN